MPGLFLTPDSGLRVLSCSEWVAPPPEGRGLAFIQGRLRRGRQGRTGADRSGLGQIDAHPSFSKKLITSPSLSLCLWQSLLSILCCVKSFPQTTESYLLKVPRVSASPLRFPSALVLASFRGKKMDFCPTL